MRPDTSPRHVSGIFLIVLAVLALQYGLLLVKDHRWQSATNAGTLHRREFLIRVEDTPPPTTLYSQDFSWHFNYARTIWNGSAPRPYSVVGHETIARGFLGVEPPGIFTFGYSPLLPLLAWPFRHWSTGAAFGLYAIVNIGLLALLFRFTLGPPVAASLLARRFLLLGLLSVSASIAAQYGQTVFLFTSLIGLTYALLTDADGAWKKPGRRAELLIVIFSVMLAAKPNDFLVLTLLLLAARAWRPLGWGVGISTFLACATGWALGGGWTWLQDYLWLLRHYTPDQLPPVLARCLNPNMSSNFASLGVHAGWLDPRQGAHLSAWLLLLGSAALLTHAWNNGTPRSVLAGLILLFLLTSPHLFHYEDVALILLIPLGLERLSPRKQGLLLIFLALAVDADPVNGLLVDAGGPAWPMAAIGKLALALLLWPLLTERKTPTYCPA